MRWVAILFAALACVLLPGGEVAGQDVEQDTIPIASRILPELDSASREAGDEGEEEPDDEIETDRDSFTPATTVVGYKRLVVESAWSYIDNRSVADTNSLPELICRYGVSDWLELRVGFNYEVGGAPNSVSGDDGEDQPTNGRKIERDSQIFYGLKAAITSQRGWRPMSVLIVQAGTPTSGSDTATQMFATYAVGWTFANRWKWDTALRYGYDTFADEPVNVWAPSTVLKIPLGKRWAVHGEYFAILRNGSTVNDQHYFSPGVSYLLTSNLEIGTRFGWGLSQDAPRFFMNTGFGWRY
jgi:hypothetical protein